MSMAGYTKLFNSIIGSSVWRSGKETKILWITLLAMAEKTGIANAATPGLAAMAGLSIEETERGLKELLSPDKYSRTKDYDGRRIEEVDGGWLILNHAKYRAKMSADERREYKAEKQREYRERDAAARTKKSTRGHRGHNAEAETKADASNGTTTARGPKKMASAEDRQALRECVEELSQLRGVDFDRMLEGVTNGIARTGKRQCAPCLDLDKISAAQAKRSLLDAQSLLNREREKQHDPA